MPSKSRPALEDIRDNILLAQRIVEGVRFEQFEKDRILFYAATRCLEIVSEASRRLPQDLRERHPALPWREIRDAGNFYRHQYGNIAEARVWRTIGQSLPALLAAVTFELDRLDADDTG
jgi:uncharacterized protein with HEPN domain